VKVTNIKELEVTNSKVLRGEVSQYVYNYLVSPYSIPLNERLVQFKIKAAECQVKIISTVTGEELELESQTDGSTKGSNEFLFAKVSMDTLLYHDYRVIAMSNQGERMTLSDGFDPFAVRITAHFSRVGDTSSATILGIFIAIIVAAVLWSLSYIQIAGIVDLIKPCRKKPPSPEELARAKYRREIQEALEISPIKQQKYDKDGKPIVDESAKIQKFDAGPAGIGIPMENAFKDSFFEDDPYIGITRFPAQENKILKMTDMKSKTEVKVKEGI